MIDVIEYLKKTWILGEYECWSLVVDVYKKELNILLPTINLGTLDQKTVRNTFTNHDANNLFHSIVSPTHFAIVAMGRRWFSHVGIYLKTQDGDRILHNQRIAGVLCQTIEEVEKNITIIGYYGLK